MFHSVDFRLDEESAFRTPTALGNYGKASLREAGYSATCQDDVDRLNERIALIWSDRVNSANLWGCFCRFSRTEQAAAGADLSDD